MPLTRDEIKEKKRLAERRRMENIRKDPEKYAQWKIKMKETYLQRKKEGKIVSVQNLPPKQQKIARKKSRESSRRWYDKKKLKDRAIQSVDEMTNECDPTDNTEINDPLNLELPSSPEFEIISKSSEILSSSQALNQPSPHSARITRSTIRQNRTPELNLTIYKNYVSSNADVPSRIIKSPSPNTSLSDSPRAPSRQSSVASSPQRIVSPQAVRETSVKKKSHWKHILRKFKSRYSKELQLKDQKILELKRINENYRKKIKRLENIIRLRDVHKRQNKNESGNEKIQLADSAPGNEIKDESQFVTDESESEIKTENLM